MKKIILLSALGLVLSITGNTYADDDNLGGGVSSNAPFAINAQICKLNDGKTMEDYHSLNDKFYKWTKKHDVELTVVSHVPFYSHGNFNNPTKYDFIEFLIGPNVGKTWDKWLSKKDSEKLRDEWAEVATCYVKAASGNFLYANEDELNKRDLRYAEWNWCNVRDGKKAEDLIIEHNRIANNLSKNPNGIIGWLTFVPHLGGANLPTFAHIVLYPDVDSVMKNKMAERSGAWKDRRDYETEFAQCNGSSLMQEEILYRP
jgi:hypothetical protein